MELLLSIPLEVRLAVLVLLGLLVGGQINRGIYRLAWNPRPIGPFAPLPAGAPPRRWYDYLPVVGWLGLARESPLHGRGYWVRPLLVELAAGGGFAALYWWELRGGLLPALPGIAPEELARLYPGVVHAQYVAHVALFSLLAVATFIDLDEKTIPDEITTPGTLLGLVLAALAPHSLLAVPVPVLGGGRDLDFLQVTSPQVRVEANWPEWLGGGGGLALAAMMFAAWWLAVAPKTWWDRGGTRKALRLMAASMVRHRAARRFAWVLAAGLAGIGGVWLLDGPAGGPHWRALFTALVGMVFAGGLVWVVRILGSGVLGKEAMGFGDVTLMAMIGAYVGWQSSLIVFFLAPFAGLVIAVAQYLLTRRRDIAYGPFLCAATFVLVIRWPLIWDTWGEPVFQMGWLVPGMVAVCLLLMALLLGVWRLIGEQLAGGGP